MPLGTFDRTPPPLFKQGPSALSKLVFFSALALFLLVADARLKIAHPVRAALATLLYPVQRLAMLPVEWIENAGTYLKAVEDIRLAEAHVRKQLVHLSARAGQVEQLSLENERLRKLLELRTQLTTPSQAAEVLYDAADPYTRKVVIDRGLVHGVEAGSPVIDEAGVLGQVTRAHPLVSEVTLLTDRDQAIPVLNTRTGARSVAFGDPMAYGGGLELRYMPGNADVQAGDLLTTSGVDGVYPAGLPVARVDRVERRADSAFARIHCTPLAQTSSVRDVMVLKPLSAQIPERPRPDDTTVAPKKGANK